MCRTQSTNPAHSFRKSGAGISCSPATRGILGLLDPRIREGFDRCATFNQADSLSRTWFSVRCGFSDPRQERLFGDLIEHIDTTYPEGKGRYNIHRAKFLDELVRLVPEGTAQFGRQVTHLEEVADSVMIHFEDGRTESASAVIGCDGIRSTVRNTGLSTINSDSEPRYSGCYAYRALIPYCQARAALGDEASGNGTIWCGSGNYITTYPVDHGSFLNVIAMKQTEMSEWEHEEWKVAATKETVLRDFQNMGEPLRQMLGLIDSPERWALFELPSVTKFCCGRICILGDAAHASTPHQGAGAAMGFEDAYVMSRLLSQLRTDKDIPRTFEAFDAVRRPRVQKLVRTSREAGEMFATLLGEDQKEFARMKAKAERMRWIWDVDLPGQVVDAINMVSDGSDFSDRDQVL